VSNYPSGSKFDVKLWMAEIFFDNAGERTFDVTIENVLVLNDIDLIQDIPGKFIAKSYSFETPPVTDNTITMVFTAVKDFAKVSGIEILYDAEGQQ